MRLPINSEGASIESRRVVRANPHERGTTNTVEGVHPPLPACVYTRAVYKH